MQNAQLYIRPENDDLNEEIFAANSEEQGEEWMYMARLTSISDSQTETAHVSCLNEIESQQSLYTNSDIMSFPFWLENEKKRY